MSTTTIRPATTADAAAIVALLQEAALPVVDLERSASVRLWAAVDGNDVPVGGIGLERYGPSALLRSLVVVPHARDRGIGRDLVVAVEREARAAGVRELVLLTRTAGPFFERLGYSAVPRDSVLAAVRSSAEFRELCPASAVCMSKSFAPEPHGAPHG